MSRAEGLVLKLLAVVLVPVVLGLAGFVSILWTDSRDSAPSINPYVAPENPWGLIDYVKKSTVSIRCGEGTGSGFAFELDSDSRYDNAIWRFALPKESQTLILTNHHVVADCATETVFVTLFSGEIVAGTILSFDEQNDLAAVSIEEEVSPLYAARYTFDSGYWVMASGSPLGLGRTVTFGNIINIEGTRIYTSASLNRGNSGGPLVDNEGLVLGVNTGYRAVAQNINWAIDMNALCDEMAECRNPTHGLIHPSEWPE